MERGGDNVYQGEAMSELKIQYAYKDNKLYNVNDPEIKTGDKCFWVDRGKKYEVYPAKGEKQRAHFRCMPGVVIDANRAFHKDCQYYLQETKFFELDDVIIQASEVLLEHEAAYRIKEDIPNYSMIPDCLFLDAQGHILCIIEVWYTHKKSDEDIKKINEYKIITFEAKYENDFHKPTGITKLYDGTGPSIERSQECIQDQQATIDRVRREIQRVREEIQRAREFEYQFNEMVKEEIKKWIHEQSLHKNPA